MLPTIDRVGFDAQLTRKSWLTDMKIKPLALDALASGLRM
jgi:hypothetical protein